jgi:hypothetical protein
MRGKVLASGVLLPMGKTGVAARAAIIPLYTFCTFVAAIISSFFVLFVPAPAWKRVTIITIVAVLFPVVANDYKLIILLPAAMAIVAVQDASPARAKAFWLLAFLLIPKSYLYFHGMGISNIVNPALLLGLFWVSISGIEAWQRGLKDFKARLAWYFSKSPVAFSKS